MNYQEKELVLNSIISGKIKFKILDHNIIYTHPNKAIKEAADEIYLATIEDNRFEEWLTDEEIKFLLIRKGKWSLDSDSNLEQIKKRIEDLQINLYLAAVNFGDVDKASKTLKLTKEKCDNMLRTRHSYSNLTLEGYAANIRNQYIIFNSTMIDGEPLKNRPFSHALLNKIIISIRENSLDLSVYRELARTEPWRGYWVSGENNIFGKPVVDLTDEQRILIALSKRYDNAFKNPECPPEYVIANDDMFDGWSYHYMRKIEKEKGENSIQQDKYGNAQEVGIVAHTKEQIERIQNMNNLEAKMKLKERRAVLQSAGDKKVRDSDLPDNRRTIVMKHNELRKRGKK